MSEEPRIDFSVSHEVGGPGRRKPPLPFSVVDHAIHDIAIPGERVAWHSTYAGAREEADQLNAQRARLDPAARRARADAERDVANSGRDVYSEPWAARWKTLVEERFGEGNSQSSRRRRALILALSRQPGGQTTHENAMRLTPELEAAYAKKNPAAFNSDIQHLYLMDLIEIPPLRRGIVRISAFRIFDSDALGGRE